MAVLAVVVLLDAFEVQHVFGWWLPGVVMVGGAVVATLLLNRRLGLSRSAAEEIAELEAQGMLVDTPFRATRAFQVEEFEDEGSTYFLEIGDGRVLCLNGQYLYEYEPGDREPRRFPCTDFVVRRHRIHDWVAEIVCRGEPLEPEVVARPYSTAELDRDEFPGDGTILLEPYEEVKRRRTAPG